MEENDTINMLIRVLRQDNRSQFDTYSYKSAPICEDAKELREFLFENYQDEFKPASDANSFRVGYIVGKNRRLTISSNSNLDEVYSSQKNGWITLWVDSHDFQPQQKGLKRSLGNNSCSPSSSTSQGTDAEPSEFESRLKRLRDKHGEDLQEFKLKVWAKMLVNGTYTSEDMPPRIPFFTGLRAKEIPDSSVRRQGETSRQESQVPSRTISEAPVTVLNQETRIQLRSSIIQQLKDLKSLEECGAVTKEQFEEQRNKLLKEMSDV